MNVEELFNRCISANKKGLETIRARDVFDYVKCPFLVFCNKFVAKDKQDTLDEYQTLLANRGKEHEEFICKDRYPGMVPIEFKTDEEGFQFLLSELKKGTSALRGMPIFYMPENLMGKIDILEKTKGNPSVFGNYYYIIKEVKLAKNIKKEHIIQTAFYNYTLGKIQGFTPNTFYLINNENKEFEYNFKEYERELLEIINDVRSIINGKFKPTPTYGSVGYPWENFTNTEAIKSNDISLVCGIGGKTKDKLVEAGFLTIKDLAKASVNDLTKIKGIGDTKAKLFKLSVEALIKNQPIIFNKNEIKLPSRKTEIFLDLEGTDENDPDTIRIDYLIGIIKRKNNNNVYKSFIAENEAQEKEMFRNFIDFIKKEEDFVIYHWHHYERIHFETLCERHKLDEATRVFILSQMVDLLPIVKKSIVFPTYSNSLKDIAKYLKPNSWRHDDVNALQSIVLYLEYLKTKDKTKLQKILDYNEDDCKATLLIKDYLNSVKNGKVRII